MPTIPTYERPTNVPSASGLRIPLSAAGHIGDALAGLGAELNKVAQKREQSEALTTAQSILGETRLGVEGDLETLRRSGMSSQQFLKDSQAVYKKWTDNANERAKTIRTPEAAAYLAQKLNEFGISSQIALGKEVSTKFKDEQRAGVVAQIPEIESRAIRAGTPEEMQSAVGELHAFLGSHTQFALTQEEATKLYLESVDNIREQRVRNAILADPVGGLNLLGSQKASDLHPEQVDRLTRFATAQISAAEAKERREEAEAEKRQKRISKVEETAVTNDIIVGRDVTQSVLNNRNLDGDTKRALLDWQKSYRAEGKAAKSDPTEKLRWRIAANTGRDPDTGKAIRWADIARAPGLNSDDKGDLIEKLGARNERLEGKAETLRDKRRGRGEQQIRLLLSGKDGLLATITGSSGDSFNDLNLYEALMEYDAAVDQHSRRDPMDIADEVATRHARAVITRFAGSTQKILKAYNVNSLDELLDKVETGEVPRHQGDTILRLGDFLKEADPAPKKPDQGDAPQDPVEPHRSSFDAVRQWMNRLLHGPAAGRSQPPANK